MFPKPKYSVEVNNIVRARSGVVSKTVIAEEIYEVTGNHVDRMTVYRYQKRLGLI